MTPLPLRDVPLFVLASSSQSRLRVLRDAGFDPRVVVSGVAEDPTDGSVAEIAGQLAERKARAVAAGFADVAALVLGCDSLLELDGKAHGKPGSRKSFLAQWRRMAGSEATLVTGHYLCDTASGRGVSEVVGTVVRFGRPTAAELEAYAATGEPLELAGACSLEGLGAPFIDGIVGDPSNVLGLSLPALRRMLASLGYRITEFWRPELTPATAVPVAPAGPLPRAES